MPTAHDVVADYLKSKADRTKPDANRELVARRTREIVDELPDGFTRKDVGVCVLALLGDTEAAELTPPQKSRQMSQTLAELVADDLLKLEGSIYSHRPIGGVR